MLLHDVNIRLPQLTESARSIGRPFIADLSWLEPVLVFFPLIWFAFIINAITGTMLLVGDAATKLRNPDFYFKMVLVFIGVIVLRKMQASVFGNTQVDSAPVPADAKKLAWVSIACWLGAITAGRLLAYVGPVAGLVRSGQ